MKTLKQYCERNNYASIAAILIDWLMIFLLVYLAIKIDNFIFSLIAIWFIGIKQYALGEVFVHEASHNNLFKTNKYNTSLQFLFSYPFLTSVEAYRVEHIPHHNFLGECNIDPLCRIYKNHGLDSANPNIFWVWFIRPLLGIYSLQFFAVKFINLKIKEYKFTLLFYALLIYTAYTFGVLKEFILYWFIPFFWCVPAFYCWQEIEDHYNARDIARTNKGFLRNFLAHNTGYHYAHHKCPGIPWYNLAKAHNAHFSNSRDITSGFFDTFLALRKEIPEAEINPICIEKNNK